MNYYDYEWNKLVWILLFTAAGVLIIAKLIGKL